MNNHEKPSQSLPNPNEGEGENSSELEICREAIQTYLEALYEFSGTQVPEELRQRYEAAAEQNAEILSRKSTPVRLGSPTWAHTKLMYTFNPDFDKQPAFSISPNGMNADDFQKWRQFVKEKFDLKGLKFREND